MPNRNGEDDDNRFSQSELDKQADLMDYYGVDTPEDLEDAMDSDDRID